MAPARHTLHMTAARYTLTGSPRAYHHGWTPPASPFKPHASARHRAGSLSSPQSVLLVCILTAILKPRAASHRGVPCAPTTRPPATRASRGRAPQPDPPAPVRTRRAPPMQLLHSRIKQHASADVQLPPSSPQLPQAASWTRPHSAQTTSATHTDRSIVTPLLPPPPGSQPRHHQSA